MLKIIAAVICFVSLPALAVDTNALTEPQVTEILETINEGEIDAANLALRKATNTDVMDFAKTMAHSHKANKEKTVDFARKNKIDGKTSDVAKNLEADAKKTHKELSALDKAAFDRAYVDSQVKMHEMALATINEKLIPNSKNTGLVDHLEKTRGEVAQHLKHAKELQSKLK